MAIDLSGLLDRGAILPKATATSRKQVIVKLADALAERLKLESRAVVEAVMERERLDSTAVGDGVAIPHTHIAGLDASVGAYLRLEQGVDFDAVDERPCDLFFMLLAPQRAGADHLRALAQVSRAFRQSTVRERLRQAETDAEVRAILCAGTRDVSAA
jgi:nitrogen PTS system EIIA component